MTVTVSDPVLPALLPSRNEPLSLDVTTDPLDLSITVLFSSGLWEVAYQDGVFSRGYLNSTRAGSHFEIIRLGGWPAGSTFTAKVKEATAPPVAVVNPWGVLYEVDFTTLPNQTIGAAGSYTIDGKTWWAKGAKAVNHTTSQIIAGTGLSFTVAGALGYQGATDLPNGTFNTQVLFMPLAQLPGFNPLATTAVWARFGETTAWPGGTLVSISVGLIDAANNGANILAAVRGAQMWCGFTESATGHTMMSGTGGYLTGNGTYNSTVLSDHSYGIVRPTQTTGIAMLAPWTGAFQSPMGTLDKTAPLAATLAPANLGVAFLLNSQTSWTHQVMRLQILQPKVS